MALTFGGASSDRVDHGSDVSLDSLDPCTHLMWLYPTTLSTGRGLYNKEGSQRIRVETHFSTASRILASYRQSSGNDESDTADGFLSTDAWQCVFITYDSGRGGNRVRIYGGDIDTAISEASYSFNVNTGTGGRDDSSADLLVGNGIGLSSPFQGRIAVMAIWNVVLSLIEMEAQKLALRPEVQENNCVLFSNYGWGGANAVDWSSKRNNGTVTGATVANHVPIALPTRQVWIEVPAGPITQTVEGTLTSTGTITKQPAVSYAGTLTSAGTVLKLTAVSYAGILTSSGALSAIKTVLQSLAGTLTSSGIIAKQTAVSHAGSLTSAGTIVKQTALSYAGTLTSSGTVSAVKTFLQSLSGTLTSSGTLVSLPQKVIGGTLSSTGAVVKETAVSYAGTLTSSGAVSAVKTFLQSLSGTLTSAGTITAMPQKALAGTLATAGNITKKAAVSYAGVLTTAGAVIKKTSISLAGALSTAGAIASQLNPVTITIDLTLKARSFALSLPSRAFALSLKARDFALTLKDRGT